MHGPKIHVGVLACTRVEGPWFGGVCKLVFVKPDRRVTGTCKNLTLDAMIINEIHATVKTTCTKAWTSTYVTYTVTIIVKHE